MTYFDGHRVYNGCPDSTMQKRLDAEATLLSELKKIEPDARITYFPMEEKFQAHIWGKTLSGMCNSYKEAIEEALIGLCNSA